MKLLNFRLQSNAVQEGKFYDLMWKNYSGNLDSDKIYAFTRYTENEKLLVVINFDFTQMHTFRLVLGEHLLETMNCPLKGTMMLTEVFEHDFSDSFATEDVLEHGLPISILPNSALVFRLEWK